MGYKTSKIETCVCCGEEIPEGRQVCPTCEQGNRKKVLPTEEKNCDFEVEIVKAIAKECYGVELKYEPKTAKRQGNER